MRFGFILLLVLGALPGPNPAAEVHLPAFPVQFSYAASPETLAPLDSIVPGHDVFFSGEAHRAAGNEERHFALFAYLHRRAGVRYYVKEGSYSYAYFVDKYVQTGQEQWLDTALVTIRQARGPEAEPELRLWRQLRAFNQPLPAGQRVQVLGIDTEPYWSQAVLRDLLRQHGPPPAPLRPVVAQLLGLTSAEPLNVMQLHRKDQARMKPVLQAAQAATQAHRSLLQQWLGPDARHWEVLIDNPAALLRSEANLARNFARLHRQLPAGGYLLQYGRLHSQQFRRGWLAERLARQHKVLSFQPYYVNCRVAWSPKPYQDTRWLPTDLAQLLSQRAGDNAHTLVLPRPADATARRLARYGPVLIVERNLAF